jgi:hypothetical protein
MSLAPHLLPTACDFIAADENINPVFRAAVARSPRFIRGTDENAEFRAEQLEDERLDARLEMDGENDV